MGRFFSLDSPLMTFLSRMADLIMLNVIAFICCIPIVTIGASWTALHYVTMKMVKDEEGYIVKGFFKSFKENFRQATTIWVIFLLVLGLFYGDYMIIKYSGLEIPQFVKIFIIAIAVVFLFVSLYTFPVLARFDNSIKRTIKNSFIMSIINLPRTILLILIYLLPALVVLLTLQAVPFVVLFGMSLPAYLASRVFRKIFKRFEPEEEEFVDPFELRMAGLMVKEEGTGIELNECMENQTEINENTVE